jgi:hypothetical protein
MDQPKMPTKQASARKTFGFYFQMMIDKGLELAGLDDLFGIVSPSKQQATGKRVIRYGIGPSNGGVPFRMDGE